MSGAPYILLQLKATHFAGSSFENNAKGVFSNALRETARYKYIPVIENDTYIEISSDRYSFCEAYTQQMYDTDNRIATENCYDHRPIRLIKLKLINNVTV